MDQLVTKAYLLALLKEHNYTINEESEIPDDMYELFCTKVEEQMREAVCVALVSADNEQRKELREPKDIDAILLQLKIFARKKD
jgi:hypothetical protein